MRLNYGQPSEALAAELLEVANAANELMEALLGRHNAPLPADFPREQLADICRSLINLPAGTAEGCRVPLEYSRSRLPAIRREHIHIEGRAQNDDVPLTRGGLLDTKLAHLISAVTTALDEYRRAAAEEPEPDTAPEAGIKPPPNLVEGALENSQSLGKSLEDAKRDVDASTAPDSDPADKLRRQIEDARGINRMSSAELRMPRITVGWLRKTIDALKAYPTLIKKSTAALRVGGDVLKIGYDRWHEFKHNGVEFLFKEFSKTIDSIDRAVVILEAQKVIPNGAVDLPPLPEACIAVLDERGGPMTAPQIYALLLQTDFASKIAKDWPATKPYRRIYTALVLRERNVGDVINIGSGYWALTEWVPKGDIKKIRARRDMPDRKAHSEKTRLGMLAARERGIQIGQPPKMTADDIAKAKKLHAEGVLMSEIANQIGVSTMTIYKSVPELRNRRRPRKRRGS